MPNTQMTLGFFLTKMLEYFVTCHDLHNLYHDQEDYIYIMYNEDGRIIQLTDTAISRKIPSVLVNYSINDTSIADFRHKITSKFKDFVRTFDLSPSYGGKKPLIQINTTSLREKLQCYVAFDSKFTFASKQIITTSPNTSLHSIYMLPALTHKLNLCDYVDEHMLQLLALTNSTEEDVKRYYCHFSTNTARGIQQVNNITMDYLYHFCNGIPTGVSDIVIDYLGSHQLLTNEFEYGWTNILFGTLSGT